MVDLDDTSIYPDSIDGYSTLPLVRNQVDEIKAEDHNRLRNAIVRIQQELGTNPSGSFATVAARLNDVSDASALIEAHLIDTSDAHDASAISILDPGDNYVSTDVEGALSELAAILPVALDVIGEDNTDIPNSGIPEFFNQNGTLFVFNSSGANDVKKTQPVNITGIHIIEIGEANGEGTCTLELTALSPHTLRWTAPGDTAGANVDISSLTAGQVITLSSNDTSKKIRIARTTDALNSAALPPPDTFEIYSLKAKTGAYSLSGTGIVDSNFITRTAIGTTGTSRNQFMIRGIVYPADRGTLVLQRKLRSATQFSPLAVLDLSDNFDEDERANGQPAYTPSLVNFDTILLFDRQPARKDYETLASDANESQVYENFDISATFSPFQIAKFLIPASNNTIVSGSLSSPADISAAEVNGRVSTYRLVHYIPGVTDFNGEPDPTEIFSISDAFGSSNDGDNTVRMSNVFVDSDTTRPGIIGPPILRPVLDTEVIERIVSGIHYFNSPDDLFDVEILSDNNLFDKAYLRDDILRFTTDVFTFPVGDGYGQNVKVTQLLDDGYTLYSNSNPPDFTSATKDHAYYLINSTINDSRRIYPDQNKFSVHSHYRATFYDPFGPGNTDDAYGKISDTQLRILVNSYSYYRATDTEEYFTDESRRVGSLENFTFKLDRGQFTHNYGPGSSGNTLKPWDNTVPLDTVVDVNISTANGLQCGGKFGNTTEPDDTADFVYPGLIYPQDNYLAHSEYNGEFFETVVLRPLQFNLVDYSGFTGDRFYQRLFNLGKATNGGRLRVVSSGSSLVSFNDIASSNPNRFCKIEVKIPGSDLNSTGWLDISKFFITGEYDDGDGALIPPLDGGEGDFTVSFTFGERNNADTGNMIAVKVTYFGAEITTAKKKVISLLQILEP